MTELEKQMAEALRRIADPRNTHFAGDAQVVAREALALFDAQAAEQAAGNEKTVCPYCQSEWVTGEQHDRNLAAHLAKQAAGGGEAVPVQRFDEHLRRQVKIVLEGWTLPSDARKVLEAALYATPIPPATPAAPSDPRPKWMPTNALAGAVCSVAEARGFVAFGAGVYRIQETQEPGLVVTFRRDGEQHYGVGDLASEVDTTPIQADDIIVRLQFTSVAGLGSLEHHLRSIRAQHWPETAPSPAPAESPAAPAPADWTDVRMELEAAGRDDLSQWVSRKLATANSPAPAEPAPAPVQQVGELTAEQRDAQEAPFEAWWEKHGQFQRAGGGAYEKTFAWHAWCAALSTRAQPLSDAQPRLTVRLTSFPESNGKRNWTALLVRADKWGGLIGNCGGVSLARGELWNRVAYHAECARLLIGERDTEPDILDYGDDIATPDLWPGEIRGGRALAARGGA